MNNAATHLHDQEFEIVDDLIEAIERIMTEHNFQ
jgi:hypothetical protein